MPVFKADPIIQCDGGGGGDDEEDDDSSGENTSETDVDVEDDEEEEEEESEEESSSSSSEEEDEQEADQQEEEINNKRVRNTRNGGPSPSTSTSASAAAALERGRVTRQYARDQLPTKRLLRSRKTSPVAGAGNKKQPQVFPCPNCKKEFNNKTSVNRHIQWCKPKNRTPKKKATTPKEEVNKSSSSNKKTPTSAKRSASASKELSSKETPPEGNVKRRRGRPKKSDAAQSSSTTPTGPVNNSRLFHEEPVPEDDFMLQRSPESSPGPPDTSSESDYEQREFAANAHHLNSNRNRVVSIDVENPDLEEEDDDPDEEEHHHHQVYHHHHELQQVQQPMYMEMEEMDQQEMVMQANGPVTCPKCNMTYRTRQGYENHFPSCTAYSSSEEEDDDEDVEVDVVDDGVNPHNSGVVVPSWNQNAQSLNVNMEPNVRNVNGSLEEGGEVEESSEEESSSENESQEGPSAEQVQIHPSSEQERHQHIPKAAPAQVPHSDALQVPTPVLETPVISTNPVQRETHNPIPIPTIQHVPQPQSYTSNPVQSQPSPPASATVPTASTVLSSHMQQFLPPPLHSQVQQQTSQPIHYNFTPSSSSSPLASAASLSTPLLHHAQASSNTPTYTQAQLMPGTVLHNSVMQVQQQMSTSAGPPPSSVPDNCYQPNGSQPSGGPSNIPQLLMNNNISQPVLRVQNGGVPQSLNGSYQLPHQLPPSMQMIPPQQQQQQHHPQNSAFVSVPPPQQHMQHQILRNGNGGPIIVDQRLQMQPSAMAMTHPTEQLPSHPHQQVPQGQFQNGLPEQFQYSNGNATMPMYSLNNMPQQAHQLQQQQQFQHPQQIGTQQNFQAPSSQQHPAHVPNPNLQQQQQMIPTQQESQPGTGPQNGTQFPPQQQQNPMQIQYFQQSIPKQGTADPSNGMASLQHMMQNGFNGQPQNIGNSSAPPQALHYQMQQQAQGQQQFIRPMFQPQQQQQAPPNIIPGQQQLTPQMFQNPFQNQMAQGQGAPPTTPTDLQQQQNQQLQQQLQIYQMQMQQQQAGQMQQAVASNDALKTTPTPQIPGQFAINSSGGIVQWNNKPGMQFLQCQQQLQRPLNPQQSSSEATAAASSQQQHQFQAIQPQQQQNSTSPQQQIPQQVIQQIAQITDGSGNTYIIVAPSPSQQNGGVAGSSNNVNNVLNLLPGLQNLQSAQQQQQQAQAQQHQQQSSQQNAQLVHCALQNVNQAPSHASGVAPPGSAGRSGPCPCPSCKDKLSGSSNALDKFKKVLPYPSANISQHSPTDQQLKPILPNLGSITTRPILIRPAGIKPPRPVRAQTPKNVPETSSMHQQNMMILTSPQQGSPLRVLPLAMKMVMPSTAATTQVTNAQQQQQPIGGSGGVPTSSPNVAVVRPMENPLQKLTDQISQIETTFMSPSASAAAFQQQHPLAPPTTGSPQPQQQQVASSPSPILQQQLPQGPHLTLVTASPPPPQSSNSQTPLSSLSPSQLQQLGILPSVGSPIRQAIVNSAVQNLQPRLMLVDHGSPIPSPSPSKPSTPTPSSTASTPVKSAAAMAGVKRKIDPLTSPEATSSANKAIKFTLKRKEGGDSYSVMGSPNHLSDSSTPPSGTGTYKNLKIKGKIKSGEQAGTSSDVLVVPCIHTVPLPDPDGDDPAGGNRTIAEDTNGNVEHVAGDNNNEGSSSKRRLLYRAVIVYEVQSNDAVLFRSSDVRAVWSYILETVQGTRLNHNLPPLPYPATDVSLPHNDPEADTAFKKLGLTHEAVKFLLEELKVLLARKQQLASTAAASSSSSSSSASDSARSKATSSSSSQSSSPEKEGDEDADEDADEPLPENPSGCARTERFIGRKYFDMFGWLASKHRKSVLCSAPTESARRLSAPLSSRFRKLSKDTSLIVAWSTIHGRGLFTKRDIEKGELVIEYAGEVIRPMVCDMREKYYEFKAMGCYMFRVKDHVIDATMKGNAARFINHSCEPNCEAKAKEISGKDRIIIYALRKINRGEELTYDYKFEKEEEKIPCTCGSKHCRKYLN